MSDHITVKVDTTSVEKLISLLPEYQAVTGKGAEAALREMGRQVDFAMQKGFREQPPRPVAGSIISDARARGWALNRASDSFKTGMAAALKMLGGAKSGFFRITESNGKISADPVMLGTSGRILKRGGLGRGALVTARSMAPSGAVRLNAQALATVRALNLREKAGKGGYMSTAFLTYKNVKQGGDTLDLSFIAKNSEKTGSVHATRTRLEIDGNVPHTARIGARDGVVGRAFEKGADYYRESMFLYVVNKAKRTLAKAG